MRTTVILEDRLVDIAKEYTGIKKTSELLNRALEEMVQKEAAIRLGSLGGSLRNFDIQAPPRRRY